MTKLVQRAREGKDLIIFGEGSRVMDLVYIKDVVRATLMAGFSDVQGVFNVGQGVGTKVADLVRAIANVFGNGSCVVRREPVEVEDRL